MNITRNFRGTHLGPVALPYFREQRQADTIVYALGCYAFLVPLNSSMSVKDWALKIYNTYEAIQSLEVAYLLSQLSVESSLSWEHISRPTKNKSLKIARALDAGMVFKAQALMNDEETDFDMDLVECYRLNASATRPSELLATRQEKYAC